MGSTVFVSASVASFPASDGRIGYVFAREAYDKKDGKRATERNISAIGTRADIVEHIFQMAQSIPGGMLQTRYSSTSSFITGMLKLLDAPLALTNTETRLSNNKSGFSDAINNENRQLVMDILAKHSRHDLAQKVAAPVREGGENITIDLARDFDLCLDLLKRNAEGNRPISIWQFKRTMHTEGPGVSEALPSPTKIQPTIELLQIPISDSYAFGRQNLGLMDGEVIGAGEFWQVEGALIHRLTHLEASHPGLYKKALSRFYEARDAGPAPMPLDTLVHIDAENASKWTQEQLARDMGRVFGQPAIKGEFTLDQLDEALNQVKDEERSSVRYRMVRMMCDTDITRFDLQGADEQDLLRPRARG